MKQALTQEVAMAIQKGDLDYARLLADMDFVRTNHCDPVRSKVMTKNQIEGHNFLIRKLRNPV